MLLYFQAEQWLPYPVERVFAFFANPANLPRLMPSWQDARIETITIVPPVPRSAAGSQGIFAGTGTRLTLSARVLPFSPIRLRWEALIEDFGWSHGFCDLQLRGPFRYWRHCHSVEPMLSTFDGSPGTLLRDRVAYEPPLGGLGLFAEKMVLHRLLTAAFGYRHRQTARLLADAVPARA